MEQNLKLVPLSEDGREKFIRDLQSAFAVAVAETFGADAGEAIPREDIEQSLDAASAEAYRILADGQEIGGAVLVIDPKTRRNSLDLLFVDPSFHGKGVGGAIWNEIEKLHPETEVWKTHTPYFEKRNIHFYVNKCGFRIVEFYNPHHPGTHLPSEPVPGGDCFFRFEKEMLPRGRK